MTSFIAGPELYWLLLYIVAVFIARANVPPQKALEQFIDTCWFWVPVMALLSFALWWCPAVEKDWLMLRIWLSGLVGGHFTMEKLMKAYSTQGPGVGMGYLAGLLFIFALLVVGSVAIFILS
jgi:hypothetical protein